MDIKVIKETGYEEAALGFSLSYNSSIERAKKILPKYAFGIPGENKFLESIIIWIDITAPRFWWQEFDTYRVGVTKQSESTMHTLCKKPLDNSNFEYPLPEESLKRLNDLRILAVGKEMPLDKFKNELPEGFLQRRIVCLNYKSLQNIIGQRLTHRLPQWKYFCNEVLSQLQHREFVEKAS